MRVQALLRIAALSARTIILCEVRHLARRSPIRVRDVRARLGAGVVVEGWSWVGEDRVADSVRIGSWIRW